MLPPLTPCSRETAMYAVPYSLKHTGTYNIASLSSSGTLFSCEKCKIFKKCKKNSDRYINIINKCKDMQTEENGGEYLDTRKWKALDINRKTDSKGRVHAGESYHEKDIRVFVSDIDKEPDICKHYILLPSHTFKEVKKSRKKNEIGDPLVVQRNGDVWTTLANKNKYVRIYVRM